MNDDVYPEEYHRVDLIDHVHDLVLYHYHFAMNCSMAIGYDYRVTDVVVEDQLPKMHQVDDDALVVVECPGVVDVMVDDLLTSAVMTAALN